MSGPGDTKDTDASKEKFPTGAVRDTQKNKPRFDLIPTTALRRVAMHYARAGGPDPEHPKYPLRNWEKGIPSSRCYASLLRHVFAIADGDSDEDHYSAAVFNLFCMMHWQETNNKEMDDFPVKEKVDDRDWTGSA